MVDRNARNFVLLSRSGPTSKSAIGLIQEMNDRGIKVHAPACDIGDDVAVSNVLKRLIGSMPSIKGCIQASMVLRVGLISYCFCPIVKLCGRIGFWKIHLSPSSLTS